MIPSIVDDSRPIRWRFGVGAAIAMTLLALLPQLLLIGQSGRDWQGTYVSFDFDEVAYASYLNALIDGRPRRNDPYTGRTDTPEQALPESLHSIQFVPAYAAALPARWLSLSTGTTFILVRAVAAFASTLALFWLLVLITRDDHLAAAGAVVLLCLGAVAAEPNDAWRILSLRWTGELLPFLRSYVPALVFPLFFIFMGLVWRALREDRIPAAVRTAVLAGFILTLSIFSYFFLWTAAIAWLFIIATLWMSATRFKERKVILVFAIPTLVAAMALVPYGVLLSRRAATVDAAQLLTHTRVPVVSFSVVIGLLVLLVMVIAVRLRRLQWREPETLFTLSLALLPAVCFNQQLVTGLLLQPVHYGRYSSNYASLMAAFLAGVLIFRGKQQPVVSNGLHNRILFLIVLTVFGWAIVETNVRSARLIKDLSSRDRAQKVAWRLRELAATKPAETNSQPLAVFCSDRLLSDTLPNTAPQPVLWAAHLFVFSGASAVENRERLYQQLHYSDVDDQEFARLVSKPSFLQLALFGWERMEQKRHVRAITEDDVELETKLYANYIATFDATKERAPLVGYLVTPVSGAPSLANFDRWYNRDAGERVGEYLIYRTRLK